jgi:hypothetical protein
MVASCVSSCRFSTRESTCTFCNDQEVPVPAARDGLPKDERVTALGLSYRPELRSYDREVRRRGRSRHKRYTSEEQLNDRGDAPRALSEPPPKVWKNHAPALVRLSVACMRLGPRQLRFAVSQQRLAGGQEDWGIPERGHSSSYQQEEVATHHQGLTEEKVHLLAYALTPRLAAPAPANCIASSEQHSPQA